MEAKSFAISENGKVMLQGLGRAVDTMSKIRSLLKLGANELEQLAEDDAFETYECLSQLNWLDASVGEAVGDKDWPAAVNPKLAHLCQGIVEASTLHGRLTEVINLQLRPICSQWEQHNKAGAQAPDLDKFATVDYDWLSQDSLHHSNHSVAS